MKRRRKSRQALARAVLIAAAVMLATACTSPSTRAEAEAKAPPSAPLTPAALPVVLTQIKTEAGSCTPAFENNNCAAVGNPGDICIAAGSNANPIRASLKFVIAGPGANTAEIQKMTIGLGADMTCPTDVQDDFPDFTTTCEYVPASPGNAMQVRDDNEVNRTWNYTLTVKARNGCDPVIIHPIINNGGGSGSSDDDPP